MAYRVVPVLSSRITAASEVISGPWGHPEIWLVVILEAAVSVAASYANAGLPRIREADSPAESRREKTVRFLQGDFFCFFIV